MKKHTNIFFWDYADEPPFIDMLKFSRKHPELHLFQVYNKQTQLYVYVFASNAAIAKAQASKFIYPRFMHDEYPIKFLKTIKYF